MIRSPFFRLTHAGLLAISIAAVGLSCNKSRRAGVAQKTEYPETRRQDQVDTIHGAAIADPYRWLEDDNSAETKDWVERQNKVTFGYLESIPERRELHERLEKIWNYERYGTPIKRGDRYFFSRNDGLQNQSVMYVMEGLNGEPRVLLDPNRLSSDGTVALSNFDVDYDGNKVVYGLSDGGSDWRTFHVKDVATGEDLADKIQWVKFSEAAWARNGQGFFYSRYEEPQKGAELSGANYFQKLYFHELGTSQADDKLVYERPDQKEWGFGATVSDDGEYLLISIWQGTERKNRLYYKVLSVEDSPVIELLNDFDAEYEFIDNDGPVLWIRTDLKAPRGRVIAIDLRNPARENWREVIAEQTDTLQTVSLVNNTLVAGYLTDAHSAIRFYDFDGRMTKELELPAIGSAGGFGGRRTDTEAFYQYSNFSTPWAVYRYDFSRGESEVFRKPKVDFDSEAYETKQVFYNSKDGTRIPMFICHKKGIKLDGNTPTYLYGYGGFNASMPPTFSVPNLVWMERGGIYAHANLRGGGEYGKQWHDAGRLLNKQNVFDDFIGAAQWLIDNNYTKKEKLAIGGTSNGGLLVGACMVQRPDLYGACLPNVGVLDMLRFQLFTIGWAWASDYGKLEDAATFENLRKYSPYHNVKAGTCYPPTLVTTGDHDDRVVPAHSFKFAAALQEAQSCDNPILIRIETRAGHGAGKSTKVQIEEAADRWAFVLKAFGE
ncbi:MAG TPA: prolyl oligopeptidase family serine peptidase [Phycisphaerae bacterium]|nr:prolyl oligopeptidase family serine peptidase [Phycisphaerae bacterium]